MAKLFLKRKKIIKRWILSYELEESEMKSEAMVMTWQNYGNVISNPLSFPLGWVTDSMVLVQGVQ